MVNKSRILSDLSKFAVDAMSTLSSLRKEIETMVSLRVDKVINKMNLVKRDEFDALKRLVQKSIIDKEKSTKPSKKESIKRKKHLLEKKAPKTSNYSHFFSQSIYLTCETSF